VSQDYVRLLSLYEPRRMSYLRSFLFKDRSHVGGGGGGLQLRRDDVPARAPTHPLFPRIADARTPDAWWQARGGRKVKT